MPEKSLTIAAYAAGASIAAATLVYVFGPTLFLDEVDSSLQNDRNRIAIGLSNAANDCFINSTLQALAGLPTLRLYLGRELHKRQSDGKDVYLMLDNGVEEKEKTIAQTRPEWLHLSIQSGLLTVALKDMLDALNQRPASRKTISAQPFITAVEQAFKTKVSRQQQDAQELLHLLLERLADEYYAGRKARLRAGLSNDSKGRSISGKADHAATSIAEDDAITSTAEEDATTSTTEDDSITSTAEKDVATSTVKDDAVTSTGKDYGVTITAEINGTDSTLDRTASGDPHEHISEKTSQDNPLHDLPFEGKISSQLECSTCHFKPKAATTSFVTLTLNVPHNASSTSLDACLDGMLKIEHIDDFRCDQCRLEHAIEVVGKQLLRTSLSPDQRRTLEVNQARIFDAMNTDPEHPPKDLQLPDAASAPKRRITRYMRISTFPSVLAVHLSRSVWDGHSSSSKNTAKVSFPEILLLGSLIERKKYKLMSVVTHKGGHNSGHYETFRRQWAQPPGTDDEKSISKATPNSSPHITASDRHLEPGVREESLEPISSGHHKPHSTSAAATRLIAQSPRLKATSQAKIADRKRKAQDRWWRISDDKVKECKLNDVLGMQKEIYLLFYELVTP